MEKSSGQHLLMTSMTKLLINQNKIINSPEFQSFKKILQKNKKGYSQIFLSVQAKEGEETENIMSALQNLRKAPEDELFRLFDFMKRKDLHSIDELIEGYMMAQGFRLGKVHEINMLPVTSVPVMKSLSSFNSSQAEPATYQTTASPFSDAGSASLGSQKTAESEEQIPADVTIEDRTLSVDKIESLHLSPQPQLSRSEISSKEEPEFPINIASYEEELTQKQKDKEERVVCENNDSEKKEDEIGKLTRRNRMEEFLKKQHHNDDHTEDKSDAEMDSEEVDKPGETPQGTQSIAASSATDKTEGPESGKVDTQKAGVTAENESSDNTSTKLESLHLNPQTPSEDEEPAFKINVASFDEVLAQKETVALEKEQKRLTVERALRRSGMEDPKEKHLEENKSESSAAELEDLKKSLSHLEDLPDDPALAETEEQQSTAKPVDKLPNVRFARFQARKAELSGYDEQNTTETAPEEVKDEKPGEDEEIDNREDDEAEKVADRYLADVSWKFLNFKEKLGKLRGRYYVIRFSENLCDDVENDNKETVRMLILKSKREGLWGISKQQRQSLDKNV